MRGMEFEGTIEPARPGGAGGGALVVLPPEVVEVVGTRRATPVQGTLNGVGYRTTTMPLGGGVYAMGVHKATRDAAGVGYGDRVTITIEVGEPKQVVVPPELQVALDADPEARAAWERLAPSHRRAHAEAVAEARKPETRARRVEKALAMLRG